MFARDEHAVRAIVGNDFERAPGIAALLPLCAGVQRVHDAHDLGRARVLEPYEIDIVIAGAIEALDDPLQAVDVARAIGNDERVRAGDVREVTLLRNQRSQGRHQLRGIHVLNLDHLCDDLVRGRAHAIRQVVRRHLARVRVGQDLRDIARLHRHEAVHLQDRQECLIERLGRHRCRREDRDVRAHAGVDDERAAGDRADGLDDLRDVCVAKGRGNRLLLLLLSGGDRPGEAAQQPQRE